ncbi:MAG: HAD-IA family hydrolase [Acidobacteriota bacterium]|nr:HAD-IA family hydrolase [Acidobacteriota bacterium]MDQ7088448.1 HAD-IA family hydrolase [Acidobacteriota bacterium]
MPSDRTELPPGARRLPRPPEVLLFDLDGVLVETFDAWVAVLDACRRHRGLAPLGPEPIRRTWGQGILADCRTFFPGTDPARLAREYDQGFARHLEKVKPMAGVGALLTLLRRRGIPTAVVTNSPAAMTRRLLAGVQADGRPLGEFFDVVACGDEVQRGKPAPELLELALERLGHGVPGSVMVGDTDNDRLAAQAAGIPFVGFCISGDECVECLDQLAPRLGLSE